MRYPTQAEVKAELSRRSLLKFVKHVQPDFLDGWFHRDLCNELEKFYQDVIAGKNPKLMIFAPPQHGKSNLISQKFPAWAMGKNPDLRFVDASYASHLAEKNCAFTQQVIEHENYRAAFPKIKMGLSDEFDESGKKQTSKIFELSGARGYYKAIGVGGSLTGFSYDIGIIDDPFKDHVEANSETTREMVWNWYSTVFYTRKAPAHGVIIVNTRWHVDDLCGRLEELEKDEWRIINYKGISTEDEKNRRAGEALHPERYPLNQLMDFRDKFPQHFEAMYQGSPVIGEGNSFKAPMFRIGPIPEKFDYKFLTADTAYKEKQKNDYQVFSVWGVVKDDLYLVDCIREKKQAAQVEDWAGPFIKSYSGYNFRGAYIEPKGHGIYLNQKFPSCGILIPSEDDLKEFYNDRHHDKTQRASNALPHLARRVVTINERIPFAHDLVQEALAFPKGKNDDFVDTLIDACKYAWGNITGHFSKLISPEPSRPPVERFRGDAW